MQQDLLGREPFVTLLNNIITQKISAHEGFSFAIDGKWGCGKSWIVKELEKKLESRYFVVHYNCWENEYYDEPLVAILSVVIDKLNQIENKIKSQKKIQTIKNAVNFLAEAASIVAKNKIGIDFNELKKAGKKAIDADKKKIFQTDFDKNQPLKKTLEAVQDNLLKLKQEFGGVIFIVDELDRCLPEYAIKVMQRLHHICYNNDSDSFIFIQLAAINKSELLGSIAKTFGREFNLTQKFTNPDTRPGTIVCDNFDETQIQFGNYYFKKFFQMVIPVSNGEKIDNPLSLLDGFENNFDSTDVTGKEYVERFFTEVLSFFPMRTKLELVNLVKTAHEITAMDGSLDKNLKYNTLCIELIDCFCKSVLKKTLPVVKLQRGTNQNYRHYLFLQIPNISNIEGIVNTLELEKAFAKWSSSTCSESQYVFEGRNRSSVYEFDLLRPEAYIKAFYKQGQSIELKVSGHGPIESEQKFIEAFRKTLNILV